MNRDLVLNTNEIGNDVIVSVGGYIDTQTAPNFGEYVVKTHINNPTKKIIIDFDKVEMITSAGIRQLLLFSSSFL